MRLTQHSDYALRLLMYLALEEGRVATIREVAEAYGISRNHLMKVAQRLGAAGWIEPLRGRGGGLRLGKPAGRIRIGAVLRDTEEDFRLVECFDPASDGCRITPACRLKGALDEARRAFLGVLDGFTLAELVARPGELAALLERPSATSAR